MKNINDWLEILKSLPLPFLMVDPTGSKKVHLRTDRIIEAVLIASLSGIGSGMFTTYVMTKVLDTKLGDLSKRVDDNKADITKMRSDLYIPRQ